MDQQEGNNGRKYKEATGSLWKPDTVGDVLEGEVLASTEDEYGLHFKVRAKTGGIVTTPAHRVLQDRLETVMADSGGRVAGCHIWIEYKGENRSSKGRVARIYKVLYDNSHLAPQAAQPTLSRSAPIGAAMRSNAEGIDTEYEDVDIPSEFDDMSGTER